MSTSLGSPASARSKTALEIACLIKAGFPALHIVSWEEDRVEETLRQIARDQARALFLWSSVRGLRHCGLDGVHPIANTERLLPALDAIGRFVENRSAFRDLPVPETRCIFVFFDIHAHWGDRAERDWGGTREVIRQVRELLPRLESEGNTFVAVAPSLSIPDDLQKDLTVIDFPMPSPEDLDAVLSSIETDGVRLAMASKEERSRIIDACRGMTVKEARNALYKAWTAAFERDEALTIGCLESLNRDKAQIIRKTGILEFCEPKETMEDVAGLSVLKDWLELKRDVLDRLEAAGEYGLRAPKGVLLVGVPGCGKSMIAKAVAKRFRTPLVRMDVGRVFGRWVGTSEHNMRTAIRTAEALAPVVLWIDEVEKAFAGVAGQGDSGTSSRVFGTFLSWMQEREASVFVVATANDVERLPDEFKRKGRFDQIFFVDLPNGAERNDVLRLHIARRLGHRAGFNAEAFDYPRLVAETDSFSSAEIEQAIVEGLELAFHAQREPDSQFLLKGVRTITPIGKRSGGRIQKLRAEAREYARWASAESDE